ncbi:MAG: hypothetical protein CME65_00450 [Halobacteriovoraceae bacterium]|nr:hypothetical protein [Halobacteriovoraceae bacterium]|tara:strand:+ start:6557 stop:8197 length:1641 start_codon:yes stop_codon:yes gene_type:complete
MLPYNIGMLSIVAEIGNYSVKIITYRIEKKRIKLLTTENLTLEDETINAQTERNIVWSAKFKLIKDFLDEIDVENQLIICMPPELVTTRFLSLPVKNKKRARQLLPFQIEEDLPYGLSEAHWADRLHTEGELTHATVAIVRQETFNEFFALLKQSGLEPIILTSDVAAYAQYIEMHETEYEQCCAIIDIGHHVTNGYIYQDGLLVSNHQSFTAGNLITEAISKTYEISEDEAILYKHQNSFLLLEDQYEKVNENQKEFAHMMDTVLEPLINEIKRWDIGHRVKYGSTVKKFYLTGSTANIKNIKNYLSEKLKVPVESFDPYKHLDQSNIDQDEKIKNRFSPAVTTALVSTRKTGLINLLKGDYVFDNKYGLPLEPFTFVFSRAMIFALVTSLFFFVNYFVTSSAAKKARGASLNILKNPSLDIGSTRAKRPEYILSKLEKENKNIVQEVKSIQASLKINALRHVQDVISFLQGRDVEIIYFSAIEDTSLSRPADKLKHEIDFVIKGNKLEDLKDIANSFEQSGRKWKINMDEKKLELSVKGLGELL